VLSNTAFKYYMLVYLPLHVSAELCGHYQVVYKWMCILPDDGCIIWPKRVVANTRTWLCYSVLILDN